MLTASFALRGWVNFKPRLLSLSRPFSVIEGWRLQWLRACVGDSARCAATLHASCAARAPARPENPNLIVYDSFLSRECIVTSATGCGVTVLTDFESYCIELISFFGLLIKYHVAELVSYYKQGVCVCAWRAISLF